MTSLKLQLRRALWAILAATSFLFYNHYNAKAHLYAKLWPAWKETVFFCETWANISLIIMIVSLILLLKEKE